MTDYECPSCRGGFPATDAVDDECPWCGEAMDGRSSSSGSSSLLAPLEQSRAVESTATMPGEPLDTTIERDDSPLRQLPEEGSPGPGRRVPVAADDDVEAVSHATMLDKLRGDYE